MLISLIIAALCILGILGYASALARKSTATHTGARAPAYVTGVYPAPENLQKGYAASFPTIAALQTHLLYTFRVPRRLPPTMRFVAARIEPDMATSTLVYASPSTTLRISQTPIIVNVREPGSQPVRIHGIAAYQLTTTGSSTVVWIRRPLKYIVVALGANHADEALQAATLL